MSTQYYEGTVHGATAVTANYRFVIVANDGTVLIGTTGVGNGVITDIGNGGIGDPCTVVMSGQTKVYAAATITPDDYLSTHTSGGGAAVATSGQIVIAAALNGASAGELVDCVVSVAKPQHSAAP